LRADSCIHGVHGMTCLGLLGADILLAILRAYQLGRNEQRWQNWRCCIAHTIVKQHSGAQCSEHPRGSAGRRCGGYSAAAIGPCSIMLAPQLSPQKEVAAALVLLGFDESQSTLDLLDSTLEGIVQVWIMQITHLF
jgi:hypothetical protein